MNNNLISFPILFNNNLNHFCLNQTLNLQNPQLNQKVDQTVQKILPLIPAKRKRKLPDNSPIFPSETEVSISESFNSQMSTLSSKNVFILPPITYKNFSSFNFQKKISKQELKERIIEIAKGLDLNFDGTIPWQSLADRYNEQKEINEVEVTNISLKQMFKRYTEIIKKNFKNFNEVMAYNQSEELSAICKIAQNFKLKRREDRTTIPWKEICTAYYKTMPNLTPLNSDEFRYRFAKYSEIIKMNLKNSSILSQNSENNSINPASAEINSRLISEYEDFFSPPTPFLSNFLDEDNQSPDPTAPLASLLNDKSQEELASLTNSSLSSLNSTSLFPPVPNSSFLQNSVQESVAIVNDKENIESTKKGKKSKKQIVRKRSLKKIQTDKIFEKIIEIVKEIGLNSSGTFPWKAVADKYNLKEKPSISHQDLKIKFERRVRAYLKTANLPRSTCKESLKSRLNKKIKEKSDKNLEDSCSSSLSSCENIFYPNDISPASPFPYFSSIYAFPTIDNFSTLDYPFFNYASESPLTPLGTSFMDKRDKTADENIYTGQCF